MTLSDPGGKMKPEAQARFGLRLACASGFDSRAGHVYESGPHKKGVP